MDSPKLAAVVGLGGALAVGGVVLLGSGFATALAATFPSVSLGAWLMIIGLIGVVIGTIVVERGSAQTVEKVETELSLPNVVANFPWWSATIGGFAALILYAALRRNRGATKVETVAPSTDTQALSAKSPTGRKTLVEHLTPVADQAVSNAVTIGLAALGVPSLAQLTGTLFRFMEEPKKDNPMNGTGLNSNGRATGIGDLLGQFIPQRK